MKLPHAPNRQLHRTLTGLFIADLSTTGKIVLLLAHWLVCSSPIFQQPARLYWYKHIDWFVHGRSFNNRQDCTVTSTLTDLFMADLSTTTKIVLLLAHVQGQPSFPWGSTLLWRTLCMMDLCEWTHSRCYLVYWKEGRACQEKRERYKGSASFLAEIYVT